MLGNSSALGDSGKPSCRRSALRPWLAGAVQSPEKRLYKSRTMTMVATIGLKAVGMGAGVGCINMLRTGSTPHPRILRDLCSMPYHDDVKNASVCVAVAKNRWAFTSHWEIDPPVLLKVP